AEIVAERDRFGELLVKAQHLGDGPRDLRYLQRVRQPGPVVIARRREEDLRLVLQTSEGLAVDDPVAVALERGPDVVFRLGAEAAARARALGRLRGEQIALARLELFSDGGHTINTELTEERRVRTNKNTNNTLWSQRPL